MLMLEIDWRRGPGPAIAQFPGDITYQRRTNSEFCTIRAHQESHDSPGPLKELVTVHSMALFT